MYAPILQWSLEMARNQGSLIWSFHKLSADVTIPQILNTIFVD